MTHYLSKYHVYADPLRDIALQLTKSTRVPHKVVSVMPGTWEYEQGYRFQIVQVYRDGRYQQIGSNEVYLEN